MPGAEVSLWRRRAVLMGQVTTVLSGLAAVLLLAGVLLDAGRPASSKVAFRPATNWPEIKSGVPVLQTLSNADQRPNAIVGSLVSPSRTDNTEQLQVGLAAASRPSQIVSAGRAEMLQGSEASVSGPNHEAQPNVPVAFASRDEPTAREPAESKVKSDLDSGVPTVTRSSAPEHRASEASTRRQVKAAALDPERPEKTAQQARSRAQQSLSAKPPASGAEIERGNQRHTSAQQTGIAGARQRGVAAPPEPPAVDQTAREEERMRLLGIPLPTGSELKQCFLEFRC
jgi:hypothetical protein